MEVWTRGAPRTTSGRTRRMSSEKITERSMNAEKGRRGPFGETVSRGSAVQARGRQALCAEMQAEVGGWGRVPGVFAVGAQLWSRCTQPRILASQAFPETLNSCGTGLRR